MYRVLVLCHANRWRSPLAEGCIREHCGRMGLDCEVVVDISSAGFKEAGKPAGKPVRNVAAELGFSLENHTSRMCTPELVEEADLVVYMDGGNLKRLRMLRECDPIGSHPHPEEGSRWRCLGPFCLPARRRIEDLAFISPRTNRENFDRVVRYIEQACRTLVETVIAPEARKRQA